MAKRLPPSSRDKTARLWDATTGKPLGEPMRHEGDVVAVSFSPDGKTIATASDDKTARLWDATTGKPLGEPMRHEGDVTAVSFSPDGKTIATASIDGTARLWNATTGKPLGEPMRHEGRCFGLDLQSRRQNDRTRAGTTPRNSGTRRRGSRWASRCGMQEQSPP